MKKLLLFLMSVLVLVGIMYAAGEVVYYQGNVAAITGTFKGFYLDSAQIKATASARKIQVPQGVGYNLKIWLLDPDTREESLSVQIKINTLRGVDNPSDSVHKYLGVLDFGYDNKADTFYYYGEFSSFTLYSETPAAGANAADSIAHVVYSFTTLR